MNLKRLEILYQYLEDDPQDPFNTYAIALEYLAENPNKALHLFEELLDTHPDYVGTYYHAAKLYAQLDKKEKAKETYEKGFAISKAQGENHAYRELQNAYNEFLFEEEE